MRPHRALLHPNIDMIYGGSCVERSNSNPGQAAPNTRHEMDGETGAEQRAGSWGVAQLRRLKVSALDGISIIPGPPEAATRAPAPVPRVKDAANLCNSCEGLVLFIQAATMYY